MHDDLLSALQIPHGLILVAGLTGMGKTTAVEGVLADPRCPPNVVFLGDLCGDVELAQRAAALARSSVVVAVHRIQRASGVFQRMIDMGVAAADVAEIVPVAFSTCLCRPVLLHEKLIVTAAIRALIVAGADYDAIHRQAIADGMCSLRQRGLSDPRLAKDTVHYYMPED